MLRGIRQVAQDMLIRSKQGSISRPRKASRWCWSGIVEVSNHVGPILDEKLEALSVDDLGTGDDSGMGSGYLATALDVGYHIPFIPWRLLKRKMRYRSRLRLEERRMWRKLCRSGLPITDSTLYDTACGANNDIWEDILGSGKRGKSENRVGKSIGVDWIWTGCRNGRRRREL